jgi:hypothetical protein
MYDDRPSGQLSRRLLGLFALVALALIALDMAGLVPTPKPSAPPAAAVRLRSVTVLAQLQTLASPGQQPFMAVAPGGELDVTDRLNQSLLRFGPDGRPIGAWGPRLDATSQIGEIGGIAVSADRRYMLDRASFVLIELDATGRVLSRVDLKPFGVYGPNGLAVDATSDVVYIADTGRSRILVISPEGRLLSTIGSEGHELGQLKQPMAVALAPGGDLFVADWENARIERWQSTADGWLATSAWSTGFQPWGVGVDERGRVYVPDTESDQVDVYSSDGQLLARLGDNPTPLGVRHPTQIAFGADRTQPYVLGDEAIARLTVDDGPAATPTSLPTPGLPFRWAIPLGLAAVGIGAAVLFGRRLVAQGVGLGAGARLPALPTTIWPWRGRVALVHPLAGAALACVLALAARMATPPAGDTAAAGFAGGPRLGLYAVAGLVLALSVPYGAGRGTAPLRLTRRGYLLVALAVGSSLAVTAFEALRLRADIADAFAPWLWIGSVLVLLAGAVVATARTLSRGEPADSRTGRLWRKPALLIYAGIVLLAIALRVPALDHIPMGIHPDEGERASVAFDVLHGTAPAAWFDTGWFFISMVYFRLLAATMAVFGANVGGGRMLNALVGVVFVAVVGFFGVRAFGWRIGLLGMLLTATIGISLEHSRLISETGPTAFLWAVSIAAFFEAARHRRPWAFALAGIAGGLSLYFYASARLWPLGAALSLLVIISHARGAPWRERLLGSCLVAVGAGIAAAPFLVHLSLQPDELTRRFAETTVLDPANQERLTYLTPPEPLARLVALQAERALGLFDRYPDPFGFYPRDQPALPALPAALALVGAFYVTFRAPSQPRLALLAIWFWVGLSGVFLTVETPDYIRAVGLLPVLGLVMAVPFVTTLDRALRLVGQARLGTLNVAQASAWVLAALVGALIAQSEVRSYIETFQVVPPAWSPFVQEGSRVAALGKIGPVYALEDAGFLVTSGWVRLLAPQVQGGTIPNPGRELPALAPATASDPAPEPLGLPGAEEGASFVLGGDTDQVAYVSLLKLLYPGGTLTTTPDNGRTYAVSPAALAATRGVTVLWPGAPAQSVDHFGQIPGDAALPARLTWRAGLRLPRSATYRWEVGAPDGVQLSVDSVAVPASGKLVAARGLHLVELVADVARADQAITLAVAEDGAPVRPLPPGSTYSVMDAPWGLLGQPDRPALTAADDALTHSFLDATIATAFFEPEVGPLPLPNAIEWSGTLLAPRAGSYRMAFVAEDDMQLALDGTVTPVATMRSPSWRAVGVGSIVELSAGPHRVRVTLRVTHDGRELARWDWVPPSADGAADDGSDWSVVPPSALRPDVPVRVVP